MSGEEEWVNEKGSWVQKGKGGIGAEGRRIKGEGLEGVEVAARVAVQEAAKVEKLQAQVRAQGEYKEVEGGVRGVAGVQEKLWEGCGISQPVGLAVREDGMGMGDIFVACWKDRFVVQKELGWGDELGKFGEGSGLRPYHVVIREDGEAIAVTYMCDHVVAVWEIVSGVKIGYTGQNGQPGREEGRYSYPHGVTGLRSGGFAVTDRYNKRVVALDGNGRWQRVIANTFEDYVYGIIEVAEKEGTVAAVAVGVANGTVEIVGEMDGRLLRRVGPLHLRPESMAVDVAGRLIAGGGVVRLNGEWIYDRYAIVVVESDGREVVTAAARVNTWVSIAPLTDGGIVTSVTALNDVFVV